MQATEQDGEQTVLSVLVVLRVLLELGGDFERLDRPELLTRTTSAGC